MEGMTDLQYKDVLRRQLRVYERLLDLGVSEEAKKVILEAIEDINKTLEA